ncbi:zinc finger and BTB domain-containing protein 11-like [Gossypium australe]|uniref:Zinc finger and BTB domain-containing protein 11-like n=1 Tax=Gossypium australe TaxID=47621 RepID=A0A5B6UJS0_9ROSI|nr:zinc finger and BTB domain-containing protein 11-like [Gossypium australe]
MRWWPGMKYDISGFVFKCLIYQQVKDDTFRMVTAINDTEMEMRQSYYEFYIGIILVYEKERYYFSYSDSKTSYNKLWVYDYILVLHFIIKEMVNLNCHVLEFQIGDTIFLKVSPWKKVLRFGCKGKISLRFIRPYKIIKKNQTYCILIGIITTA